MLDVKIVTKVGEKITEQKARIPTEVVKQGRMGGGGRWVDAIKVKDVAGVLKSAHVDDIERILNSGATEGVLGDATKVHFKLEEEVVDEPPPPPPPPPPAPKKKAAKKAKKK